MNEKDDVILEYLDSISPGAEPPTVIFYNLSERVGGKFNVEGRTGGFTIDTLRNRLNRLESYGLVEVVRKKGNYRAITEKGHKYLAGDLDASELECEG